MEKYSQSQLVSAYSDIINGYTISFIGEKKKRKKIYIKHFDYKDIHFLELERKIKEDRLITKHIKSEKEVKEELNKQKKWGAKDEDELELTRDFIDRLQKTKVRIKIDSQRDEIQAQINENAEKYNKKKRELDVLLSGRTREYFLDKMVNDYYVFLSFYWDDKFENRIMNDEVRENLDDEEFGGYVQIYNNTVGLLDTALIKHIAIKDFFLNPFSLAKTSYEFLGKPTAHFTILQTRLCSWGNNFKHILSTLDGTEPENVKENPDELIEWFEIQSNLKKEQVRGGGSTRDNNGTVTRHVGAKSKDLMRMGKAPITSGNINAAQNRGK